MNSGETHLHLWQVWRALFTHSISHALRSPFLSVELVRGNWRKWPLGGIWGEILTTLRPLHSHLVKWRNQNYSPRKGYLANSQRDDRCRCSLLEYLYNYRPRLASVSPRGAGPTTLIPRHASTTVAMERNIKREQRRSSPLSLDPIRIPYRLVGELYSTFISETSHICLCYLYFSGIILNQIFFQRQHGSSSADGCFRSIRHQGTVFSSSINQYLQSTVLNSSLQDYRQHSIDYELSMADDENDDFRYEGYSKRARAAAIGANGASAGPLSMLLLAVTVAVMYTARL